MPFITDGSATPPACPSTKLPRYDLRVHDDDEAASTTFHEVSSENHTLPAEATDILTGFATFVCGVTDLDAAGFLATTTTDGQRQLCLASVTNLHEPRSFSSHATTLTTVTAEEGVDQHDVDFEIRILAAEATAAPATKVRSHPFDLSFQLQSFLLTCLEYYSPSHLPSAPTQPTHPPPPSLSLSTHNTAPSLPPTTSSSSPPPTSLPLLPNSHSCLWRSSTRRHRRPDR